MDNHKLYVIIGVVAVALAGAYVIWGPTQKNKRKQKVPGLMNLGNSCFLNAVLQALAACPLFIHWLQVVVDKQYTKNNANCCLCISLLQLLKDLNTSHAVCCASSVIQALQMHQWIISNEEQDAHELLHVLTATLEEEIIITKPVLSLLEVTKLQAVKGENGNCLCKPFLIATGDTFENILPYRGLLSNQLICKQCGYKYPVKYDSFDSISLSLPTPHWGSVKLQDCLTKFISCELISGVSCDSCCKKKTSLESHSTFMKKMSFGKLPQCLCFHIQRTMWLSNGVPAKRFDHVYFPEILYMDNFVHNGHQLSGSKFNLVAGNRAASDSADDNEIKLRVDKSLPESIVPEEGSNNTSFQIRNHAYILKAVIVHVGDLFAGHFLTYRRGPLNSSAERKWFFTSDCSTKEVPFSEVAKVAAYMLFYEKIHNATDDKLTVNC